MGEGFGMAKDEEEKPAGRRMEGPFAFLKHPSAADIRGKRRLHKALDAPVRPYDFLVVLDFEWTCDNKRPVRPPEIIEFPSVLVEGKYPFRVLGEVQIYVKPSINAALSAFCTELTGITQATIDREGVPLREALELYEAWLRSHGLLLPAGAEGGRSRFVIVTWGDSDIGGVLGRECAHKGLGQVPEYFRSWVNLKDRFRQHFKREAKGGLQHVVESLVFTFEGRAHSGLVDSRNTAKIVVKMLQEGHRFLRPTRGLAADGSAYGSRKKRAAA